MKGKFFSIIKQHKLPAGLIAAFGIILILVALSFETNFYGLMGNSVINYYCENKDYELVGNKCIKNIQEPSILLGDVNLDNKINRDDALTISKYLNDSIKLSSKQMIAADINKDGRIDSNDHNSILSISPANDYSTSNVSNEIDYDSFERVCPKSTDRNVTYELKKDICLKTITHDAIPNNTGTFIIKYDSNGGISSDSSSMSDDQFDLSKNGNKLKKNKYIKYKDNSFKNEPYLFAGWNAYNLNTNEILCYTNASHSDEQWVNKKDEKNSLLNNGTCKYGMYIFEGESNIGNIAKPNDTIQMKAVWQPFFKINDLKNAITDLKFDKKNIAQKYNIGGFDAIYLSASRNLKDYIKDGVDKSIQDIHVMKDNNGKEILLLSQDLYSNKPHQLLITQIAEKDSKIVLSHIGQCGHGIFDVTNDVLNNQTYFVLSCDKDNTYTDKNTYGQSVYKLKFNDSLQSKVITPSNSKLIKKLANGVLQKRENVKIDKNNGKALFRSSYGGEQHFLLYNFNGNDNTIDRKLLKEFTIKKTSRKFQGYDIDGNYLYIYSGDSKPESTAAYIDVYDITTSKQVKSNTVYEYKKNNIYMEAEGISISDNYAYISMAITTKKTPIKGQKNVIGNSGTYNYKYVLVYKIEKSKLIN